MKHPAMLLAAALLLPSLASAQEIGLRPVPDVFLVASPDPLTQSVLRTQVSDQHSGGVVSARLHKVADAKGAARIDYAGAATPANLALPTPVIGRAQAASGAARELRDAPASKPAGYGSKRLIKRSIAADQLLSVVQEMRRGHDRGNADKAWERKGAKPSKY